MACMNLVKECPINPLNSFPPSLSDFSSLSLSISCYFTKSFLSSFKSSFSIYFSKYCLMKWVNSRCTNPESTKVRQRKVLLCQEPPSLTHTLDNLTRRHIAACKYHLVHSPLCPRCWGGWGILPSRQLDLQTCLNARINIFHSCFFSYKP